MDETRDVYSPRIRLGSRSPFPDGDMSDVEVFVSPRDDKIDISVFLPLPPLALPTSCYRLSEETERWKDRGGRALAGGREGVGAVSAGRKKK